MLTSEGEVEQIWRAFRVSQETNSGSSNYMLDNMMAAYNLGTSTQGPPGSFMGSSSDLQFMVAKEHLWEKEQLITQ